MMAAFASFEWTALTSRSKNQDHSVHSKYFSYKINHAGLRYEIALSLRMGHIVWTNGPFLPGLMSDLMTFRQDLRQNMSIGERIEVDNGYVADDHQWCKTPSGLSTSLNDEKRLRRRIRSRHETVNARMKKFEILNQTYRHEILRSW
jgi:hypothetical protein